MHPFGINGKQKLFMWLTVTPDAYLCCLEGELTLMPRYIPIIVAFKGLESQPFPLQVCLTGLPAEPILLLCAFTLPSH